MRSLRWAIAVAVLAGLALGACQGPGLPAEVDPVKVALQPGDLPPPFVRCPASGDLNGYLRDLHGKNPAAGAELETAWRGLQRGGATAAALAVYAQLQTACTARVGTGAGATVTSMVIRFRDDRSATTAYQRGLLGFTTPSEDEEVDDMSKGIATGLSRNSWLLQRTVQGRSLIVACWQRDSIASLVVAVDADPLHAKQAIVAMDGRIP